MKAPKKLWDHCLKMQGYIESHTVNDHFELQGQVPETVLSGQTADISPFALFGFYDWVKFWDDDKECVGWYLGPSINVGQALTAKILKANGQYIHTSTYRQLTDDEIANPDKERERNEFDTTIKDKL